MQIVIIHISGSNPAFSKKYKVFLGKQLIPVDNSFWDLSDKVYLNIKSVDYKTKVITTSEPFGIYKWEYIDTEYNDWKEGDKVIRYSGNWAGTKPGDILTLNHKDQTGGSVMCTDGFGYSKKKIYKIIKDTSLNEEYSKYDDGDIYKIKRKKIKIFE